MKTLRSMVGLGKGLLTTKYYITGENAFFTSGCSGLNVIIIVLSILDKGWSRNFFQKDNLFFEESIQSGLLYL